MDPLLGKELLDMSTHGCILSLNVYFTILGGELFLSNYTWLLSWREESRPCLGGECQHVGGSAERSVGLRPGPRPSHSNAELLFLSVCLQGDRQNRK